MMTSPVVFQLSPGRIHTLKPASAHTEASGIPTRSFRIWTGGYIHRPSYQFSRIRQRVSLLVGVCSALYLPPGAYRHSVSDFGNLRLLPVSAADLPCGLLHRSLPPLSSPLPLRSFWPFLLHCLCSLIAGCLILIWVVIPKNFQSTSIANVRRGCIIH